MKTGKGVVIQRNWTRHELLGKSAEWAAVLPMLQRCPAVVKSLSRLVVVVVRILVY